MRRRYFQDALAPGLQEAGSSPSKAFGLRRTARAVGAWKDAQARAGAATLWCDACLNTGVVDCYCGGDLCICDRYGTAPCPACGGLFAWAEEAATGLA